jgi:hypothetical protein
MAIDDPKTRAKHDADPSVTQADVMLKIAELLKDIKGENDDVLKQLALNQTEMLVRAMPENKQHPGISAYSYPEGDLKAPKPRLKCDILWVGYPETVETLTPAEIEALNALEPGNYMVTKANGNRVPFLVEAKRTLDGRVESLSVWFPCKGDQAQDHRSKLDYCREAMGEKLPTLAELQAELARVQRELAAAHAR